MARRFGSETRELICMNRARPSPAKRLFKAFFRSQSEIFLDVTGWNMNQKRMEIHWLLQMERMSSGTDSEYVNSSRERMCAVRS